MGHSMKDSICYVHDAQNSHERYTNTKNPAKNAGTLVPELKKPSHENSAPVPLPSTQVIKTVCGPKALPRSQARPAHHATFALVVVRRVPERLKLREIDPLNQGRLLRPRDRLARFVRVMLCLPTNVRSGREGGLILRFFLRTCERGTCFFVSSKKIVEPMFKALEFIKQLLFHEFFAFKSLLHATGKNYGECSGTGQYLYKKRSLLSIFHNCRLGSILRKKIPSAISSLFLCSSTQKLYGDV